MIKEQRVGNLREVIITNDHGLEVSLYNIGAAIHYIKVPDRDGNIEYVTLSSVDPAYFERSDCYHGKCIGRFSGRIKNGKYSIDGKEYQMDLNDGNNSLHGGDNGLSNQYFAYSIADDANYYYVVFHKILVDVRYPGDVDLMITYQISKNDNSIKIKFDGFSMVKNFLNLTNHTYFNLSGNLKRDVTTESLYFKTDFFYECDDELIPVSIKKHSALTDFNKPMLIGEHVFDDYFQNHQAKGYDHPFDLQGSAVLLDEESGRKMTLSTSYDTLVIYSNNYPTSEKLLGGAVDHKHLTVCLEPQYAPNSVNFKETNNGVFNHEFHEFIQYDFEVIK